MSCVYQERRLKKRREFLRIAHTKSYIVCDTCIVQYAPRDGSHPDDTVGVGFTVSKKVGGAVTRNRVKRRLREVVRLFFQDLTKHSDVDPKILSFCMYDYVLIGRKAGYGARFSKIQHDFRKAIHKITSMQGS